jgi:SAM-dependent methyltransferase
MSGQDAFHELAPHYDALMNHVDYGRWAMTAQAIAEIFAQAPAHRDAACGTGTLLSELHTYGWRSTGVDLSRAMLRAGRNLRATRTAAADLRALPFRDCFDFVTCLFDSMNFLLTPEDLHRAIAECARVLRDGGILYFDAVTERMVLQHFAGQQWKERLGRHSTAWDSRYSRHTGLSETEIRVSDGSAGTIRERMYPRAEFEAAIAAAGLEMLLCVDAETWKSPRRRTVRLDFLVAKRPPRGYARKVRECQKAVQALIA